jgi:ParB family chromosome partitioning protein
MSRKQQLDALFGVAGGASRPSGPKPSGQASPASGLPAEQSPSAALGAPNTAGAAAPGSPASSAAQPGSSSRIRAGAIGAMSASLRDIAETQARTLREQVAAGETVLTLDPGLIDPAPVADRLVHEHDPAFAALKASLAENGQQVPILIRPHPSQAGRYQAAFGHRRIRACRELGLSVKAVLRDLDDAALAIAQGQENLIRRDLSFIEKALFALGLEQSGLPRAAILRVLGTDKGDLSRYLQVAAAVPRELARRIGPAPKAGRARWLQMAAALQAAGWDAGAGLPAVLDPLFETTRFSEADSDGRFALVLTRLTKPATGAAAEEAPLEIADSAGRPIARLERRAGQSRLVLRTPQPAAGGVDFARFLADEIPDLHRRWLERARAAGAGATEP